MLSSFCYLLSLERKLFYLTRFYDNKCGLKKLDFQLHTFMQLIIFKTVSGLYLVV
jgi:hypothetical protein